MIILFVIMSVLRLPSTSQPAVAVTVESAEDDTVDICYNVGPEHPVAGVHLPVSALSHSL